jgi:hypothetical protein
MEMTTRVKEIVTEIDDRAIEIVAAQIERCADFLIGVPDHKGVQLDFLAYNRMKKLLQENRI